MIITSSTKLIAKKSFLPVIIFLTLNSFCALHTHAQAPAPFQSHEVIEIAGGQKIEILKCKGEGPIEECDCIYYTDKRQNGKRMWQNANRIREEQKAAQLEVAAARQQAKDAEAMEASTKAKEAAARKAARDNATTASSETNEVIQTIKEQNAEIKTKGTVKANEYKRPARAGKTVVNKEPVLSLKDAARRMDSINRAKAKAAEEMAMTTPPTDTALVKQEEMPATENNTSTGGETKTEPVVTIKHEAATTPPNKEIIKSTPDSAIDFATLRKMEDDGTTVGGDVPVPKPAMADTTKKMEDNGGVTAPPASEQEPAPKPKRDELKLNDEPSKNLTEDSSNPATIEPAKEDKPAGEPADKKMKKEKKAKKSKKEKAVMVESTEVPVNNEIGNTTENSATDSAVIITDPTAPKQDTGIYKTEVPAQESTESGNAGKTETSEELKTTMKDEMTATDTTITKPAEESVKKKEKKAKKSKKKKDEAVEEPTLMPPPPPAPPLSQEPLTPLQKAAQAADSLRKAKEKADSSAPTAPEDKKDINNPQQINDQGPKENSALPNDGTKAITPFSGSETSGLTADNRGKKKQP